MKDSSQVVQEFNELVNMTASELEKWLKSGDSNSAGWPKEDSSGESVGHDSGRKIVEILQANPKKDPKKYTDDQIEHMRKVVSYCKRHLAQEEKTNKEKSADEVKKTKSYASLKNWGHDFLKGKSSGNESEEEEEEEEEDAGEEETQVGDKRKQPAKAQKGSNKKHETRQGQANANGQNKSSKEDDDADVDADGEEADTKDEAQQAPRGKSTKKSTEGDDAGEEEEDEEDDKEEDGGDNKNGNGNTNGSGKSAKNGPNPGDTVSWKWGGGHPQGKVLDVKEEKATIKTKRGNEVSRKGSKEDPAVVLDAGKSKAVKAAHELD